MVHRHPVTLVGFSAFERNVLASAIRLSAQRQAAYTLVDELDEARFVVADTDSAGTLQALHEAGRIGDTVFIGAQAPEHAPAWMMRPIDAAKVLLELDVMVAQGATAGLAVARALIEPSPPRRGTSTPGPARRASDSAVTVGPSRRRA